VIKEGGSTIILEADGNFVIMSTWCESIAIARRNPCGGPF
jgi:hypothetical protein